MSGGSMNYVYSNVLEASDMTDDIEIKELLKDLSKLLHSEEWAKSADSSWDVYEKDIIAFKNKWFNSSRDERLEKYIDDEIACLKKKLYTLIGMEENK